MKIRIIALSFTLPFVLASCGGGGGDSSTNTNNVPNVAFSVDSDLVSQSTTDFVDLADNAFTNTLETPLNRVDNFLNGSTVETVYGACGEANAVYIPSIETVVLCDELTNVFFNYANTFAESPDEGAAIALGMMSFTAYHEFGHALDDLSNVAIGGNLESIADAIGVVISTRLEFSESALFAGAFFVDNTASAGSFGIHGNGVDRGGDILCWTLGGNTELRTSLPDVANQFTDVGRDCVAEYENQQAFVYNIAPPLRNLTSLSGRSKAPPMSSDALKALSKSLEGKM